MRRIVPRSSIAAAGDDGEKPVIAAPTSGTSARRAAIEAEQVRQGDAEGLRRGHPRDLGGIEHVEVDVHEHAPGAG